MLLDLDGYIPVLILIYLLKNSPSMISERDIETLAY